jgi:hypothetical protein
MEITQVLQQMKGVNAALEITRLDYEAKQRAIMATVQSDLDALRDEYTPMLDSAKDMLSGLEADAKRHVVTTGETAKIDGLAVTFVKGRTSWDTKALDGYSAAHPEIERFKREGEPSARISWK